MMCGIMGNKFIFYKSECFHAVRGCETKIYIYLTVCLTGGEEMGMSQAEKKEEFPQFTQQGDSVSGHMSDISSN